MTRNEKLTFLRQFADCHQSVWETWDKLRVVHGGSPGSELFETLAATNEFMIKIVAALIGDKDEWLEWHVHENEWGKRGHTAGYDGDVRCVLDFDDLLDLIEQGEKA